MPPGTPEDVTVYVETDLPTTPSGKIQNFVLRERLTDPATAHS